MLKNGFFIFIVSILCTSQVSAMLCIAKQMQRSSRANVRPICVSKVSYSAPRTIEYIYRDVEKIGDRKCSDVYTTTNECGEGCVRRTVTCAKSMEMQEAAQRKRDDYWRMLEAQLSSWRYFEQNVNEHVEKLRFDFFNLCMLEKSAIRFLRIMTEQDIREKQTYVVEEKEMYKKTFTLIAHKMRCLRRQVDIIHENSESVEAVKGIQEQHLAAKLYAREQMPEQWRLLCYNVSKWDHPDERIIYKESGDKE